MINIVPATSDMLNAFYGSPPRRTQRAFAFVRDAQVIGVFGLYVDDRRLVLFSDLTPELRRLKKTLVKGMKYIMGVAESIGALVHAVPDGEITGSVKLLTHFGFSPVGVDAYEWRPSGGSVTREQVNAAETRMRSLPQIELKVKHYFSKGVYGRELFIPSGTMLTGKIHKHANLNIMSAGEMSVLTEHGIERVRAPFTVVSPPGTKRIAYAHEDTVWTTIHGTDETDVDKIEAEFIAQNDAEYLEFVAAARLGVTP